MTLVDAAGYFVPDGLDRYLPSRHADGAWRRDELHLAPVSGLVTHHMEQWRAQHADPSLMIARLSFEVLGQIPCGAVELTTDVIRPGRTIELLETTAQIGDRVIIRARGWLLQTSDTADIAGDEFTPLPAPDQQPETAVEFPMSGDWPGGFIRSLHVQRVGDARPGRGRAWIRSDVPLIAGETASPLAEFVRLVDTANGVAMRQDPAEWLFPNVDLTLHLLRQPTGPWVGLDTRVAFGAAGLGITSSVMHDIHGPVGTVQQALTVRRR